MRNDKILVVDDDVSIRRLIWKSLQSTGLLIYQSDSIEKTLDIMTRVKFDLFILDISIEYENDGYHLAQLIRNQDPIVPIVFLSGKTSENDIVTGLETGADLYLTKPFTPNVLRAQIIATLDRSKQVQGTQQVNQVNELIAGAFRLDLNRCQLFKHEAPIKLSSKELKLMQFFMENPNQVFSKEQIYNSVWGNDQVDANTIMVFMNHLRSKIEDNPKNARFLKTVWGIGYTFTPTEE